MQLALEFAAVAARHDRRSQGEMPCFGHLVVEGKRILVWFRPLATFRTMRLRHAGDAAGEGPRLVEAERALEGEPEKLRGLLTGEVVVL